MFLHGQAIIRRILRVIQDRRAAVALIFAIALPITVAFAGLAVDVSLWLKSGSAVQNAADAGALTALVSASSGNSTARVTSEVDSVIAASGLTTGQGGVTITVNNPPTSGSHTATSGAWEVIVTQQQRTFFSALYLPTAPTVRGRAVGVIAGQNDCLISLNNNSSSGISVDANANVVLSSCAAAVQSTSSTGFTVSGGGAISAQSYSLAASSDSVSNHGSVTGTVNFNSASVADPYSSYTLPACTTTVSASSGIPSTGGVVCITGNLSVGTQTTLTAGVYIVSGSVSVTGGILGTGVTIIIDNTGSSCGGSCNFTFNGGATLGLTAPSSGPTAGIVLWNHGASSTTIDKINGGTTLTFTGAIYDPTSELEFQGGANVTSPCAQIVANNITMTGGTNLSGTNCTGTGVRSTTTYGGTLFE